MGHPPIRGLLEFAVYGADLNALEGFYCGVLGLQVVRRAGDRMVALRCGHTALLLFDPTVTREEGPVPEHGADGPGHFAFVVDDSERDAWRAHLRESGVEIEREVAWDEGGTSLYVRDPAGNSVELAPPAIWGGLGRALIESVDG